MKIHAEIKERIELIKEMRKVKEHYEDERDKYALLDVKYFKTNKKDFYEGFKSCLELEHDETQLKKDFNELIKTCELAGESSVNYVFSFDGVVRGYERLIEIQKQKISYVLR